MIDRLLDLLSGRAAPAVARSADDVQHAVAALLVEAARMDENFDTAQRTTIERVLGQKFDLDSHTAAPLIEAGEQSVQRTTQYLFLPPADQWPPGRGGKIRGFEMAVEGPYFGRGPPPHENMCWGICEFSFPKPNPGCAPARSQV